MNQLCKVCDEPAAGFHFGAFTCEGCKSFFGRTYNNIGAISACKNGGDCVINKKNRTACKACRLRKCLHVGMSKSGSRYGRRSNWFKIHCLLQEQQQTQHRNNNVNNNNNSGSGSGNNGDGVGDGGGGSCDERQLLDSKVNLEQLAHLHQLHAHRQTHQDKMNPFVNALSKTATQFMSTVSSALEKSENNNLAAVGTALDNQLYNQKLYITEIMSDSRHIAATQPDSAAHSKRLTISHDSPHNIQCNVVIATDSDASTTTLSDTTHMHMPHIKTDMKRFRQQQHQQQQQHSHHRRHNYHNHHARHHHHHHQQQQQNQMVRNCRSEHQHASSSDDSIDREQQFLELIRSNSEPLKGGPFLTFVSSATATAAAAAAAAAATAVKTRLKPVPTYNYTGKSALLHPFRHDDDDNNDDDHDHDNANDADDGNDDCVDDVDDHDDGRTLRLVNLTGNTHLVQDEPIDLSLKSREINYDSQMMLHTTPYTATTAAAAAVAVARAAAALGSRNRSATMTDDDVTRIVEHVQKHAPLDLTLLRAD